MLPSKTSTSLKNKCNNDLKLDMLHAPLGHVSLSKMQHIDLCNCKRLKVYNGRFVVFVHTPNSRNYHFLLAQVELWHALIYFI